MVVFQCLSRRQTLWSAGRALLIVILGFGLLQLLIFIFGRWYLDNDTETFCREGTYCESLHDESNVHRQMRFKEEVINQLESIYDQLKRNRKTLYTYSLHRQMMDLRKYVSGSEGPLALDRRWSSVEGDEGCMEIFMGGKYDKDKFLHNWKAINCTVTKETVYDFITFCFVLKGNQNDPHNLEMMESIYHLSTAHPNAKIILGVVENIKISTKLQGKNLLIQKFLAADSEGHIWNYLFRKVSTKYVFVGRDYGGDDVYSSLDRSVRLLNAYQEVGIVNFALREPDGQWSLNCYQFRILQSEIVIKEGYYRSFNESLVCDYGQGPFLVRTDLVNHDPLDSKLLDPNHIFLDFYLQMRALGVININTPDFMAPVLPQENSLATTKKSWVPFAHKWKLSSFTILDREFSLSCKDIEVHCKDASSVDEDFPTSMCCWQEVINMFKRIEEFITKHVAVCQADSVQFRAVSRLAIGLPIDLKASFYCNQESMTLFEEHSSSLNRDDYKLEYFPKDKKYIYSHKKFPNIQILITSEQQLMDAWLNSKKVDKPISKKTAERILKRIKEEVIS